VKQALFQLSYDPELFKRISLPALTGKAVLPALQSVPDRDESIFAESRKHFRASMIVYILQELAILLEQYTAFCWTRTERSAQLMCLVPRSP
jgi:hypothetical protein